MDFKYTLIELPIDLKINVATFRTVWITFSRRTYISFQKN